MQRGLDSIQAQNVRSDIFFLADDEMHGRDTPSPSNASPPVSCGRV
ncbi:MAG: hypothetical protein R3E96_01560 [Planctomycetota bacterium]